MNKAKSGDLVSVKYRGKFTDGTIFDESDIDNPFNFTLGVGEVIPGFDNGIIGMSVGETKTINILSDEAYGPYEEDLVFVINRDEIDTIENIKVGDILELPMQDQNSLFATVIEISEDDITINANHELAGKDLIFEVELLAIN